MGEILTIPCFACNTPPRVIQKRGIYTARCLVCGVCAEPSETYAGAVNNWNDRQRWIADELEHWGNFRRRFL